jgi:threonine aldolase
MIDLRSDTVTKPCSGMLEAMMRADVGDDVIDIDPTVVALQERTAELLGKEAAIFMPSGTMTNQIALRCHCFPGDEFICEAQCHVYQYEQGGFAQLSGLVARTIEGKSGLLEPDQIKGIVRKEDDHSVRSRLLCLENTHNRGGGSIYPLPLTRELCRIAREQGLATHLDGARLFNAQVATGVSAQEFCASFDSVSVCFSKGLGAPVGSCLAGSAEFVRKARRARKLFGGGMRQAGFLAAAALYALDHNIERLKVDHEHAKILAAGIEETENFRLLSGKPESNIVIFSIGEKWGSANLFSELALAKGLRCFPISFRNVRLVTHLDVSQREIEEAVRIIQELDKTS